MDYSSLNTQIEQAYNLAIQNGQRVLPYEIAPNTTLQTDIYTSKEGSGFRVMCRITNNNKNYITIRVKNYGPDTSSEVDWTNYPIFNI